MHKNILLPLVVTLFLLASSVHYLLAMGLDETMMRLKVEALKAQIDELLTNNKLAEAKELLTKMEELDQKITPVDSNHQTTKAQIAISGKKAVPEDGERAKRQRKTVMTAVPNSALGIYETTIQSVCQKMKFDPAVIWTLLAIESNFTADPVVVQKKTKCLGPWQHQPEQYIHYRKADGSPYNPFDIRDSCEVTVRIMKDNLAATGSLEKSIRMYASGTRYLNTPYSNLPKSLRAYLDKFRAIYPGARARFARYAATSQYQDTENENL